jgi:hypothetical protein
MKDMNRMTGCKWMRMDLHRRHQLLETFHILTTQMTGIREDTGGHVPMSDGIPIITCNHQLNQGQTLDAHPARPEDSRPLQYTLTRLMLIITLIDLIQIPGIDHELRHLIDLINRLLINMDTLIHLSLRFMPHLDPVQNQSNLPNQNKFTPDRGHFVPLRSFEHHMALL